MGLLYQLSSSSATTTIPSHVFSMGLCSGTSSLYGSAAGPTYFVGTATAPAATLIYGPGTGNIPYYSLNPSFTRIGTQVGTSFTSSGNFGIYTLAFPLMGTGSEISREMKFPVYIDFIKTTNDTSNQNWKVILTGCQFDNEFRAPVYCSSNQFYFQLTNLTASGPTGLVPPDTTTGWRRSVISVPVSESFYGSLDSINIFWNKTTPLEIYEIAAYQFS